MFCLFSCIDDTSSSAPPIHRKLIITKTHKRKAATATFLNSIHNFLIVRNTTFKFKNKFLVQLFK